MKTIHLYLSLLFVLPLVVTSCGNGSSVEGFQLIGNIGNAAGQQVNFDRVTVGQPNHSLTSAQLENGEFEINYPEGIEPGAYLLRIGAQRAYLILEGEENVTISGDITDLNTYNFTVEGSEATAEMANIMKGIIANGGRPTLSDIESAVTSAKSPLVANILAFNMLRRSPTPQSLPVLESALERLPELDPNYPGISNYVSQLKRALAQQRATDAVAPGQPAPDIESTSPNGTTYKLSDLKGQVVLLDFWASWCRPCRRENPNVVEVYNRYKDQGFTVFSVSLDGPDMRRNPALANDPSALAQQQENYKGRWVDAIQQDGLTWPYHVSELKKWDSQAAAAYGVTGIPKTFLIDRDGNIAQTGLRGAEAIERALREVL
ncbi:MAG: TlpA disulfide reductase family protein [Bacteroidota bacterium]